MVRDTEMTPTSHSSAGILNSAQLRRFTAQGDWFDSRLFQLCAWALLCGYAAVQIVSSIPVPLDPFDGPIQLVSADLVSRGRLPQIDFQTVYPPLQYWLISAGFRVFGNTALAQRALSAATYCILLVALARFFRNRAGRLRPFAPLMILVVAVAIGLSFCDPPGAAAALACLSIIVYVSSLDSPHSTARWVLAAAGVLAGLAALLRLNFGLYAAAAAIADLFVEALRPHSGTPAKLRFRRLAISLSIFGTSFLVCNAAVYCAIYHGRALYAVIETLKSTVAIMGTLRFMDVPRTQSWLVCWPCAWVFFREVVSANRLTPRSLSALAPAPVLVAVLVIGRTNPAAAFVLTALGAITVLFLYARVNGVDRVEFTFLLYFVFTLHYFLFRAGDSHAGPALTVLVITALLVPSRPDWVNSLERSDRGLAFFALVIVAWVAVIGPGTGLMKKAELFASGLRSLPNSMTRISDADRLAARDARSPWVVGYPPREGEAEAITFIRYQTTSGEPIFVGAQDHSRVYWNDVRIYWLSGRVPGCRQIALDAGVASRADVQDQIISDLNRNNVKWVILEDLSGVGDGPFLRKVKPDSRLLDQFLAKNFREVAKFGVFSVRRLGAAL